MQGAEQASDWYLHMPALALSMRLKVFEILWTPGTCDDLQMTTFQALLNSPCDDRDLEGGWQNGGIADVPLLQALLAPLL